MKIKPPEEIFQMQDLYNNKGKTFLIKIELNLWIPLSSVDSLTVFSTLFSGP